MCPTCDERTCSCDQPPPPSLKIPATENSISSYGASAKFINNELMISSDDYSRQTRRFRMPKADIFCTDSRGLSGASSSSTSSSQVDRSPCVYKLPPLEILDGPPKKSKSQLMVPVKKRKLRTLAPRGESVPSNRRQGADADHRDSTTDLGSNAKRRITSSVEMMYGKKSKP